jgi:short-subunit dehydrogenase
MATLITGASSGIGAEFARQIAARGGNLVLVARRKPLLDELAEELRDRCGVRATTLAHDLGAPDAAAGLHQEVESLGIAVDTLINNAGFATHGDVADADPVRLAEEIAVNCQALVGLTTRFLPAMLARHRGRIVNIASTAGFQPLPHMAVYSASKAFVLTFTEALWGETRGTGVRVLAVAPGATDTAFFQVASEAARVGPKRPVDVLVRNALHALDGSAPTYIDGFWNAAGARFGVRMAPRRVVVTLAGRSVSSDGR